MAKVAAAAIVVIVAHFAIITVAKTVATTTQSPKTTTTKTKTTAAVKPKATNKPGGKPGASTTATTMKTTTEIPTSLESTDFDGRDNYNGTGKKNATEIEKKNSSGDKGDSVIRAPGAPFRCGRWTDAECSLQCRSRQWRCHTCDGDTCVCSTTYRGPNGACAKKEEFALQTTTTSPNTAKRSNVASSTVAPSTTPSDY